MAINLTKGSNINLTKTSATLNKLLLGLGWDARVTDGQKFDLDASAFMLDASGKSLGGDNLDGFVYYDHLTSKCGSVAHKGDNRTGQGDGDDEAIEVTLSNVPANVEKIVFCVTINDAVKNNQNFGQINNAYIRIVDQDTNEEVARYDLSEDASSETAMIFGELYRHSGDWKFRAIGQGFAGGFAPLAQSFGINASYN